jgi:hypothetical protein
MAVLHVKSSILHVTLSLYGWDGLLFVSFSFRSTA